MHYKSLIIILALAGCRVAPNSYVQESVNTPVAEELSADSKISDMISPYKEGMSKAMDEVIGFSPAFIEKKKPSSALGSMMCDAVLSSSQKFLPASTETQLHFSLLNYGGIRSTLDSGDITIGEVFQIMPFENEVVILKMENRFLDTIQKFVERKGGEPMSQVNKTLYNTARGTINGHFYLITNDYMANGGDRYSFLLQATERITTGIKIRDALISYIKGNNPLPLDHSNRSL